jgi:hypothetical protein
MQCETDFLDKTIITKSYDLRLKIAATISRNELNTSYFDCIKNEYAITGKRASYFYFMKTI